MVLISSGSNAVLAARNRPKVLKYPVAKAEMMKMMAAVVSSLLVLLVRLQRYWLLSDEKIEKSGRKMDNFAIIRYICTKKPINCPI